MTRVGYSPFWTPGTSTPGGGSSSPNTYGNVWGDSGYNPQTIAMSDGDCAVLIGAMNTGAFTGIQVTVNGTPVGDNWNGDANAFGAIWQADGDGSYTIDLDVGGTVDETGAWTVTVIPAANAQGEVISVAGVAYGAPDALTFPGADVSGDGNQNDLSGPFAADAGKHVLVTLSGLTGDYASVGYLGIYSPGNASYGTLSYFGAGNVNGTHTFQADVTASDWYVWVYTDGTYDGALAGSGTVAVEA